MSKPITLLYLDPEPNNLHAFSAWFRRKEEYECHTCLSEEEALAILQRCEVKVLLADQPVPESTGLEFLVRIWSGPPVPVKITLTAHRELGRLEEACKEGRIDAYFTKPVDMEALESCIRKATAQ